MQQQELLTTLVLANAFKEGDLALGGTRDKQIRTDAQQVLAALRVRDIMATPCIDDGVSDALRRALNPALVRDIEHLTIAELRRILLGVRADGDERREQNSRACHSNETRRAKAQHLQSVSLRLRGPVRPRKLGKGRRSPQPAPSRCGGFASGTRVWLTDVK